MCASITIRWFIWAGREDFTEFQPQPGGQAQVLFSRMSSNKNKNSLSVAHVNSEMLFADSGQSRMTRKYVVFASFQPPAETVWL